ncbi:unnamed protein product [Anisakis simplex]|uniref:FLYWCH-type domain-containing protein n=1 Tax=Anisakis simplex TaxID=6269 RepID=A0A0M3IZI8_ANISI|nr:unnamed protein product [Anisakis simplex]
MNNDLRQLAYDHMRYIAVPHLAQSHISECSIEPIVNHNPFSYNHEQVFANEEELRNYVREKGWLKFKELKRVQKGGHAIYYYCKAIKWMNVRCKHMMLVVKEDNGLIIGRTTDGGLPHSHAGMRTPKRGPKQNSKFILYISLIMPPLRYRIGLPVEKRDLGVQTSLADCNDSNVMDCSAIPSRTLFEDGLKQTRSTSRRLNFTNNMHMTHTQETSQLLSTMDSEEFSEILADATPRLIEKMRDVYEARKEDEERDIAATFMNASSDLIDKMIRVHRLQSQLKQSSTLNSNTTLTSELSNSTADDLFSNASPELIEKLKQLHQEKKQREEENALKLFSAMSESKQCEVLNFYYDQSMQ